MDSSMPSLTGILRKLPWFGDLSDRHQGEMLAEIAARLVDDLADDDFRHILEQWERVAHVDAKWARLTLLRESGLLEPPYRAA